MLLLLMMISFSEWTQAQGTHFEHGLSLQQVKEKAKKENKFLLIDCVTSWCPPCKYMATEIFPQEKVGDFFNKHFVNVKVQLDQTKNDSEEVKSWYADAESIQKTYKVRAYPTYLFLSPAGDLVHSIVGGDEADAFIEKAKMALSDQTQYFTLLKKYESGNNAPDLLKALAAAADAASDPQASNYADTYLATETNLFKPENLELMFKYMSKTSSSSKYFDFTLKNVEKIEGIIGKGKAAKVLGEIIIYENIITELRDSTSNIDSLIAVAKAKYPMVDIRSATELLRTQFYSGTKKWTEVEPAILRYMKEYGTGLEAGLLYRFASDFLGRSNDPGYLRQAMEWSKRSVDQTQGKNPAYLNTYAKLLYKLNNKKEAIIIQKKAVDLSHVQEVKDIFELTLHKMKQGKPLN